MNGCWYQALTRTTTLYGVAIVASLGAGGSAWANPEGGVVAAGSAVISASGNTLNIYQSTDRAIIDWNGFDIGVGEHTQFHQPSAGSVTLNRVHSVTPSMIQGSLTANGRIVIINPNGVFFSGTSRVDVAGLIATTSNIANADFMAGDMRFNQPGSPTASIINEGYITAQEAGLVAFVAPYVENRGVIEARLGTVHLASGDSFTLDMMGDGLVSLAVTDPNVQEQLASNSGTIRAHGGTVIITAAAARDVVNSVVNNSGVIEATAMGEHRGEIILFAEGSHAVENNMASLQGVTPGSSVTRNSGRLDVSATGYGVRAGTIKILGDKVALESGSRVNASGNGGGGTVLIGGDYQGKGATPTAQQTYVDANSVIQADATHRGDGGKVIIWSDDATGYYGTVSAKGGSEQGDGGFVETSGKRYLDFQGQVDTTAAYGETGILLLDPTDITISNAADTGTMVWTGTQFNDVAAAASNLNVTTLQNRLITNNVIVTTASALGAGGDISVNDAIGWSSGNSLTLQADRKITVNAGITGSGAGNLILNSGQSVAGNITINAAIDVGGSLSLTPATGSIVINTPSLKANGITLGAATSFTGAGNFEINAHTGNLATKAITVNSNQSLQFISDTISVVGGVTAAGTSLTTGVVVFRPYTSGTTIGLGDFSTGSYHLVDVEMDYINNYRGELWIGGYTDWRQSGDITYNTSYVHMNNNKLHYVSGNDFSVSTLMINNASSVAQEWYVEANGNIIFNNGGGVGAIAGRPIPLTLMADYDNNGSGNITLASGSSITTDGAAFVASGRKITRAAGSSINTGAGRYLMYSDSPYGNTIDSSYNSYSRVYNKTYGGYGPASVTETGNVFLYASPAPVITVRANDAVRGYNTANTSFTFSYSGMVAGDDLSTIFTGQPAISSIYTPSMLPGVYENGVLIAAGSLSANPQLGYEFVFVNGKLTVSTTADFLPKSVQYVMENPKIQLSSMVMDTMKSVSASGGLDLGVEEPVYPRMEAAPVQSSPDSKPLIQIRCAVGSTQSVFCGG